MRHALVLAIVTSLFNGLFAEDVHAQSCPSDVSGQYRVQGKNADGSTYEGYAGINQTGKAVAMAWKIYEQEFEGKGRLNKCKLTVNWGTATPVVYKVLPNGELDGKWDGGRATEYLVPR